MKCLLQLLKRSYCSASSSQNYFKMLIVGPPGIGKGTFTHYIAKHFDAIPIDTGKIIRDIYKNKDEKYDKTLIDKIGKCMTTYSSYIPDDIIVPIMISHIDLYKNKSSLILDGFPRTLSQIQLFDINEYFNIIVHLNGDYNACYLKALNRISCSECGKIYCTLSLEQCNELNLPNMRPKQNGICDDCNGELIQRKSDKPDVAQKRMDIYCAETVPMIEYLIENKSRSSYKMIEYDVNNGIDDLPQLIQTIENVVS
eukprot:71351_1